ncbi:nitrate- and nitrite sensing domain-containing protein [Streptomyces sp. NPDC090306]|uniref:sensor histidine kinase n=1 Tax=Streptomyces sp. NPDC090306 TaxID=3365961 RepID=UPI0038300B76
MRFRGKSVRRKIVALLLVPLVSLTVVWGFATVVTGREASRLVNVSSVVEKVGYPTEDTVRALQQERRQTLVYIADPRASDGLSALRRSRAATDDAVARIRKNARSPDVRDAMGESTDERMTAVLDAFGGLVSLRRSVDDGTLDRVQSLGLYNRLVDPCYTLLAKLRVVDNVELDKQYRALVNLARARELLSREDALLGSSLVAGGIRRDERRDVSDLVARRTELYDVNLPLLPEAERERYERFWKSPATGPLRVAEEAVASSASDTPRGVAASSWDSAAGDVLGSLGTLNDEADDRYQERVDPVATRVLVKAVLAGVLGLVAVLVSLFLSVRVGRGLIRDLRRLRLEAHEASGVRLPGVMRRLSAGEEVDVETEAPVLQYEQSEIGEVGLALNTLQRAAVEAAVKQAELRSGVSEVFVNLARRSQVLLHKQLTLLDAMERRTEDTDELADLFRLDHLTTRMRRHAEGLVILSGAAPSRQWRKPVQLMDVVRAAVAEVEDYERIEVRRLPRIAVTGPAVADLTHLLAELLENATVFSPPHTTVQVLGDHVANGFALEIQDRGLGMAADALLDANLRLAETAEFELSDTDRLGLFVVSRIAGRQNVRASLQPSPYGGTTAVVFIPDTLLTDDVPDTDGARFRLGPEATRAEAVPRHGRAEALTGGPVRRTGLPAASFDAQAELEDVGGPTALDDIAGVPDELTDDHGGLLSSHRSIARGPATPPDGTDLRGGGRRPSDVLPGGKAPGGRDGREQDGGPAPLPRRGTPKLVTSHGRPVTDRATARNEPQDARTASATPARPGPEAPAPLPVRRSPGQSARTPLTGGPRRAAILPAQWTPAARDASSQDGPDDDRTPDASGGTDRPDAQPPLLPRRTPRAGTNPGGPAAPHGGPRRSGPAGSAPDGPAPAGASAEPSTDPGVPGASELPGVPGRLGETAPGTPAAGDATGARSAETAPAEGTTGRGRTVDPDEPHDARDGNQDRNRDRNQDLGSAPGGSLPRRVRQASLAPQLRQAAGSGTEPGTGDGTDLADRDADEVRSRMASLQRGWQRGREENAAGEDHGDGTGTAPGTTRGDGR